jgi:hypothetical protein
VEEDQFLETQRGFSEIFSGGSSKDGIPTIDDPEFRSISEIEDIGPNEPVIALQVNGADKDYPLRVLMWHEIVNYSIGGIPVTVSYCPRLRQSMCRWS